MDEDRIEDKIAEIEKYIEELESVFSFSIEEYKLDFRIRDICERHFEKIIEAVVDLAFLIIKEKKLKIPEDEESSFNILKKEDIISLELSINPKKNPHHLWCGFLRVFFWESKNQYKLHTLVCSNKQGFLILKAAKGMRNIIAHEYGKVNDELVFNAVTEELIPDVKEFLDSIGRMR